jgi:hypothetical protein
MMLKQNEFEDFFVSCLKATGIDKKSNIINEVYPFQSDLSD